MTSDLPAVRAFVDVDEAGLAAVSEERFVQAAQVIGFADDYGEALRLQLGRWLYLRREATEHGDWGGVLASFCEQTGRSDRTLRLWITQAEAHFALPIAKGANSKRRKAKKQTGNVASFAKRLPSLVASDAREVALSIKDSTERLRMAHAVHRWADEFEAAAKGYKPIETQAKPAAPVAKAKPKRREKATPKKRGTVEECKHPVGRRDRGGNCFACGEKVSK